ncbi:hypothetical protein BH11PSE12_BH11PSE12_18570 [soil metagenome]
MRDQHNVKPAVEVSEELALLRHIDKKVDSIDAQMAGLKKQAIVYGSVAGAVSGAIVAGGIVIARSHLGL